MSASDPKRTYGGVRFMVVIDGEADLERAAVTDNEIHDSVFPNSGDAICEVEVDPGAGLVEIILVGTKKLVSG